jgi:hypothetical protein
MSRSHIPGNATLKTVTGMFQILRKKNKKKLFWILDANQHSTLVTVLQFVSGLGVGLLRDSGTLMVGQYFRRNRDLAEMFLSASGGIGIAAMAAISEKNIRCMRPVNSAMQACQSQLKSLTEALFSHATSQDANLLLAYHTLLKVVQFKRQPCKIKRCCSGRKKG